DVHLRAYAAALQLDSQGGERLDDLSAVHRSNAVQGALGDEDATSAECRRRLSYRYGSKAVDVADEPEAVEESLRLNRPSRAFQTMDRGKVLRQSTEIGVLTQVPDGLRALLDRSQPRVIASTQRKLVEELANREVEVLAPAHALGQPGKRLTQPRLTRRIG